MGRSKLEKYLHFFVYTYLVISISFAAASLPGTEDDPETFKPDLHEVKGGGNTLLSAEVGLVHSSLPHRLEDEKHAVVVPKLVLSNVPLKILLFPPCLRDKSFIIYYANTPKGVETLKEEISDIIAIQVQQGKVSHFYLQHAALNTIKDPRKKDAILAYITAYIFGFISDSNIAREGVVVSFVD